MDEYDFHERILDIDDATNEEDPEDLESTELVETAVVEPVSLSDYTDSNHYYSTPDSYDEDPYENPNDELTYIVSVPGYVREQITDYSPESLSSYENNGYTAIAQYSDGTEQEVLWSEVVEPLSESIAIDVAGIAAAYNQHFWTDTYGAHVTDDEQDVWVAEYEKPNHGTLSTPTNLVPWHNLLLNSLGIILRNGLKNLASFSKAGVSFFDGEGNEATNILAAYGGQSVQIGKVTAKHVIINANGLTAYNADGTIAPVTGVFDGANITNSTIEGSKIADSTITASNIVDGTITNAKIENGTITGVKMASSTIDGSKIANSTITASNILDGTITNAKIQDGAITGAKIQGSTLTDIPYAEIDELKTRQVSAASLAASAAYISSLSANSITAQQLVADHGTIGSLDTNYMRANMTNANVSWIENGTIKDAAITNGMINSMSANKLTAGTIDASNITVTNLNASNITTGTINGQRIGTGSLSLDKLEDAVYTETEVDNMLSTMQAEIDGAIETWTGSVVPTLNNVPASNWTTNVDKDKHVGDVYFVVDSQSQQSGYNYRFTKTGTGQSVSYSWVLIKDSDVTAALSRITDLETFETTTTSWMDETDSGLTTIRQNLTTIEGTANGTAAIFTSFQQTNNKTLVEAINENSSTLSSLSTTLTNNGITSSTNISNTVNTVSQTASSNSSIISNLTSVLGTNSDGTTNASDVIHRTSSLEQDLDGFKTTVSSTYATNSRVSLAESSIQQNAADILLKVSANDVISSINLSPESATINASRVNIAGAAIFESGRLSESSLNAAYASTSDAMYESQYIYYQSDYQATAADISLTLPSGNNAYVTRTDECIVRTIVESENENSGSEEVEDIEDVDSENFTVQVTQYWSRKPPTFDAEYPVVWVVQQRKSVSGTVTNTSPVLNSSSTVIDGGQILTGSINANVINLTELLSVTDGDSGISLGGTIESLIQNSADEINESISTLASELDATIDSKVEGLATAESVSDLEDRLNLEDYATVDSVSELSENVEAIANSVGSWDDTEYDISQALSSLSDSYNTTNSEVNNLTSWIKIGQQEGTLNPILSMGQSSEGDIPQIAMELTSSEMRFVALGEALMRLGIDVSDGELESYIEIYKAVILNQLRFGQYAFIDRQNGHMSLKYIEVM